ncbi:MULTISPECIES: hypothetical protein [unclassified Nostoc]|uniref:hypothetical protein n=1 Tax=unclassified Nostoc TaxID=2593658 RepID=UPI002AD4D66B|nr:hypothetical protein [Nostoc sp. DedQUE03]MDZ7971056.1 hypothetical protein [Nostoc sp. DedQUE03]MDZ8046531.1 hypothetical protein [Nostoc sp. DedQUE02]
MSASVITVETYEVSVSQVNYSTAPLWLSLWQVRFFHQQPWSDRQISSVEMIAADLSQIAQYNPALNPIDKLTQVTGFFQRPPGY